MRMRQRHFSFSLLALLVLVAGASAGIVASVVLDQSLEEYAAGLFSGRRPAVPHTGGSPSASGNDKDAVARVKTVAQPSMVLFTVPTIDSRLSGSWITTDDAIGYGVVVSTDGWVLVHGDVLDGITNVLRGTELWIDGARYTPTQYVEDTLTDFVLVKIDATNLTPAAFGASEDVESGERVFALLAPGELLAADLASTMAGGGVPLAAERYSDAWRLQQSLPVGAGVFSGDGDLWALAGEGVVLPMHYGAAFVREVIRSGAPVHAGFGAKVVDLADPLNIDPALRQGREDGALVLSVVVDGPAAIAGMQVNDVIVAVDDVRVDEVTTLPELLRLYDPGQTARFTVVRDAAEVTLTVTFSDYEDLVY